MKQLAIAAVCLATTCATAAAHGDEPPRQGAAYYDEDRFEGRKILRAQIAIKFSDEHRGVLAILSPIKLNGKTLPLVDRWANISVVFANGAFPAECDELKMISNGEIVRTGTTWRTHSLSAENPDLKDPIGEKYQVVSSRVESDEFIRRFSEAKTAEGRVCGSVFTITELATIRDYARRLQADLPPPPTAAEKRQIQARRDHVSAMNAAVRAKHADGWLTYDTMFADASTLLVMSDMCGMRNKDMPRGLLGELFDGQSESERVRTLGFRHVECLGGKDRETLNL